ncbi:S8 family serine peptidase [Micromonospora sp. CPCC 206061]|uniref:S8 family serine peptidase n=1 Tax=Micromonospora sp. CPCC 206061 TaxID=3122410 RepID=UPI002FF00F0B
MNSELRRGLGLFTAAVLAASLLGPTPANAGPAPGDPNGDPPTKRPAKTVTLITGDRVSVAADGGLVEVTPADGQQRAAVRFSIQRQHGHLIVVPSDAARLVAEGRVDLRLFDVTTLIDFGYDDAASREVPILIGGAHSQAKLRRADLTGAGAAVTRTLTSIHGFAARTPKRDAARFWTAATATGSGVGRLWLDGLSQVSLDQSVPQIGAPTAWSAGYDGTGVTVAVLDTGIDTTHPDLAGQVVAAADFTGESNTTTDPNGHGTHVASTIAGTGAASGGQYRGVASGAKLLNGRVCRVDGRCADSAIVAGLEWAAATQHADVVNLSVGGPDTETIDPKEAAVNQLTADHGTLFVIAAGNRGDQGPETVDSPGSAEAALTVGAVTKQDALAPFSGLGPRIGDAALKPDLTGPGVDINAALSNQAGGSAARRYTRLSGTSMATPHVAGAAAILAQRRPTWTPGELKAALMASAQSASGVSAYAQGAGRVDVARAINTTLTASPPSVSLGRQLWPHTDDTPVTRTVSYRNAGSAPVTLALSLAVMDPAGAPAPAGMFGLGATSVSVPAGGQASVQVTANTQVAGPDGYYTGRITATAGGVAVATTPIAVDREGESYDLTLRHLDRQGQLATEYSTVVYGLDQQRSWRRFDPDGTLTIRVPRGRYHFDSLVTTGAGVEYTMLVRPVLEVTADTTVDVDARLAAPVTVTVPRPTARLRHGLMGYMIRSASLSFSGWDLRSLTGLSSGHLGPVVTANDMASQTVTTWGQPGPNNDYLDSPYAYHLGWIEDGRFPTGVTRHVSDSQLATYQTSYAAQTATQRYGWQHAHTAPLVNRLGWISITDRMPFTLPATRTEYYTTDSLLWSRVYAESSTPTFPSQGPDTVLETAATALSPGSYTDRWNAGPFVPGLLGPTGPGRWASRSGDVINLELPPYGDQSGHAGTSVTTTARVALFRGGTLVGESDSPGFATFTVPAAAASYRLTLDATRGTVSDFATRTSVAWTFQSQSTPDWPPTRLPLMVTRFQPNLDDRNRAPSSTAYSFPVAIDRQPGVAASALQSLTVNVSYDDGVTWQPATVSGSGDARTVTVTHPAGDGFVSLRSQAQDAGGNTVDQTIIRAYRLGGTTAPPPPVSLKAQYQVGSAAATTNQIGNQLRLVNTGTNPVSLANVKIRYWYTADGAQSQQYHCDFAAIGCAAVTGSFTSLGAPRPGADTYLELSFASGTLDAGANTGAIQSRWNKSDWTNYTQTNDHSFDPTKTASADWTRVTVHYQGQLVWGSEP